MPRSSAAMSAAALLAAAVAAAAPPFTPPPPPAPPTVRQLVNVSATIFAFGELGFPCWRVPAVVLAPSSGRLFAFAEARNYSGDGCYPHSPAGLACLAHHDASPGTPPPPLCEEGPRSLALKTSTDGGQTWGSATIVDWNGINPAVVCVRARVTCSPRAHGNM